MPMVELAMRRRLIDTIFVVSVTEIDAGVKSRDAVTGLRELCFRAHLNTGLFSCHFISQVIVCLVGAFGYLESHFLPL
jgi:hypothetical protein